MLIVVSPAKSLDYESPLATRKFTQPTMLDASAELIAVMATKSAADIASMMSISPQLAQLNLERYHDWEQPFTRRNARPAILAFNGDVYQGMDAAHSFDERDFTHAQKTLRILSGLYGVLRPLDLMMAYRLEMGTKVVTPKGRDLYDYWGDTITDDLAVAVDASPGAKVLVNLASVEYFTAVRPVRLSAADVTVVSPTFLDARDDGGEHRIVSFFAKRARGAMAGWIIRNRIASVRALREFDALGYRYDKARSRPTNPVFVRTGQP